MVSCDLLLQLPLQHAYIMCGIFSIGLVICMAFKFQEMLALRLFSHHFVIN